MRKLLMLLVICATLAGCGKDEVSPGAKFNQSEVKLKYDKEFQFTVNYGNATSLKSSDEFIGVIESNGLFKAKHIGETTITGLVDGKEISAKVIVEPYVTDILEPFISFTASKQVIKSLEKRVIVTETSDAILYKGQGSKENEVFYLFENNLMKGSILSFKIYSNLASDLAKFYSERYTYIGNENNVIYFESKDKSYALGISEGNSFGLGATYFKNTSSNNAKLSSTINIQGIKSTSVNKISELLKK